jgi:hypothetical protein
MMTFLRLGRRKARDHRHRKTQRQLRLLIKVLETIRMIRPAGIAAESLEKIDPGNPKDN